MNQLTRAQALVQVRRRLDYLQCRDSPVSFALRHCTIELPNGEVIPFRLWPMQRKTLEVFHENDSVIVLKARRLGLSWLAIVYAVWLSIFQQGVRCLILCKNEDDAAFLLARASRMVKRMIEDDTVNHLFAGIKIGRDSATVLEIGQSMIRALNATEQGARSETAGLVIIDEMAFGPAAAPTWRAVRPTAEGGGKVFAISTGNGQTGRGAEFFNQWDRAVSGESGIYPLFWPWDAHPDHDQDWYERTLRELGDEARMSVEYPSKPADGFLRADATQVYDIAGIAASERLGREYDELFEAGELPEPEGLALGIDFGEQTHCVVVVPLESGGLWIPEECVASHTDAEAEAPKHLAAAARYGELYQMRYDAAGVQSKRAWKKQAPRGLRLLAVPFGKYKQEVMDYLRQLFDRAAAGETTRIIAISPRCEVLLRQLRQLEFKDPDAGVVKKEDDHGPDALVAGAMPIAARMRKLARRAMDEEEMAA